MTGRKNVWWFDDDDTPQGGAVDISGEWDDPTFEAVVREEEARERHAELDLLTDRERFVVECAWGLRGDYPHSFREIADLMSVDEATVRRIHRGALERLRS